MSKFKLTTTLLATFLVAVLEGCSHSETTNNAALEPHWTDAFSMPDLLAEVPVLTGMDDLQALLDQAWYAAIDVQHTANPEVRSLNTCKDYFANRTPELRALREYGQSAFAELQMACEATRLLLAARTSTESFLPSSVLDENTPQRFPKEFALVTSASEREKLMADPKLAVWGDVDEIVEVDKKSAHEVRYTAADGGEQTLSELGRGDFNQDGVEDVLVRSHDSVQGGSYANVRLFVLSANKHGRWSLLDRF